jgi:rhodanese-related sulfurtransferase
VHDERRPHEGLHRLDRAEARLGSPPRVVAEARPLERKRDGALEGAVVVDRNVLEWRLDPASAHRLDVVRGYDDRVVIVCNEGYQSSLAAATLQDLGLHRATDLIGGYQALLALR